MRSEGKLLDACVVLLGPRARRAGTAVLAMLTVSTVKAAFRRLALRTHPDRVAGSRDGALFIEASRAYELLMAFLLSRGPIAHSGRPRQADPPQGQTDRGRQIYYDGPLPRRPLRLAEFLYYSGRISWQSLISALAWQRIGRPRFGEIARQLHMASAADISRVLRSRAGHEQTGAAASRLRLLSVEEVRRVLRIQRARQRPIGRYFVEKESMTNEELSRLLLKMYRHNVRSRAAARRAAGVKASA